MIFTLFGQFLVLDLTRFGEFETQMCAQSCDITENAQFCVPILVEDDDPDYGINSTNNANCLFIIRAIGNACSHLIQLPINQENKSTR